MEHRIMVSRLVPQINKAQGDKQVATVSKIGHIDILMVDVAGVLLD